MSLCLIAADAELHADLKELLLSDGSSQEYLWGANLYPEKAGADFIEYAVFNTRLYRLLLQTVPDAWNLLHP